MHGITESQTGSSKQILKSAYQVGMIKDEETWLLALMSRNNATHAYNQAIAKDKYYKFQALKYQTERLMAYRKALMEHMTGKVRELNRDNFAVRQHQVNANALAA